MEPDHFRGVFIKDQQNLNAFSPVADDYHRYMILNDQIALRSQIDCKATTSAGEIVFEIKSRAVAPLRYDIFRYTDYLDYSLNQVTGYLHSYEREYYDLIRGAFLKYYFQLKIGQMDGAFIGYHNTVSSFGFEYARVSEIERLLFGDSYKADMTFVMTTRLLSFLLDHVIKEVQSETFEFIKLGYFADGTTNKLVLIAELMDHDYAEFKQLVMDPVKGMENVVDFYDKVIGKKNLRAIRFDVSLFPILNGIINPLFYHDLRPGDSVELECEITNCGYVSYSEYMHFLLNAYKYEYMMLDQRFNGNWALAEKRFTLNTLNNV